MTAGGHKNVEGGSVVKTTEKIRARSSKKKKKRTLNGAALIGTRQKPLRDLTDEALRGYLASLNGHKPADLYQLVLGEVEKPLFTAVLGYTRGNQSEAAEILGINRGTLRKKLKAYHLLDS